MSHPKVYFKGLHALRFFAALVVLISHVEMIKEGTETPHIYNSGSFLAYSLEELGPMGVTFFFVLSGFLITFLLFTEKQKTNHIAIKKFYWRRILRIWPLYLFFTFLAFFVLPKMGIFQHYYFSQFLENNFYQKLAMYLVFVPGFVLAFFKTIPWAGHLWSIGIEEQFYLAWPWIVRKCKASHPFYLMLLIIIIALKIIVLISFKNNPSLLWMKEIAAQSKFECMIIGAWAAFCFFNYPTSKAIVFIKKSWVLAVAIIASFAITWFTPSFIQDAKHILLSPIFIIVILGVIQTKKLQLLEHPAFVFLGNISYGFYVYHMMCVVLCIQLMPNGILNWCSNNDVGNIVINILYYAGSFFITIIVSAISYYTFEKYFLKLKHKYTVISSGK